MHPDRITRRQLLRTSGLGIGSLALTWLLAQERSAAHDLRPRNPHFGPRARAVILMMQNGGPSQMDLFDPKPELTRRDGQVHVDRVETFQRGSEANRLLASPFRFLRRGRCGMEL